MSEIDTRKKILFIRLSSLGDVVLTESTIRLCKQTYPQYDIHYLTKYEYAELVRSFLNVDKVYIWDTKLSTIKQLKEESYEYIIDLHAKFTSFVIKTLISCKNRITYNKQVMLRRFIVKKLTRKKIDSVVWNYLETINQIQKDSHVPIDKKSNKHYPHLSPTPHAIERVKKIFETYNISENIPMIGIFPGAQHFTKQFPLEKIANVLLSMPEHWYCQILILGSYKEKLHAWTLKNLTEMNLIDLTGAFLPELLPAVISMIDIVISNDSGPMHIAAALQKPQIAIFGATSTSLGFRPLNKKAVVIQKNVRCQPCSLHGGKSCKRVTFDCMYDIHSTEVFNVFEKMYNDVIIKPATD
jgi:lipopolysaccharide heptosyltransferase II